jgi:hypothetical protein
MIERTDVTEALIAAIRKQQAKGIAKYPETLHTWNGRNPHQDELEELVDQWQYRWQAKLEREELFAVLAELTDNLLILELPERARASFHRAALMVARWRRR